MPTDKELEEAIKAFDNEASVLSDKRLCIKSALEAAEHERNRARVLAYDFTD